MQTSTLTLRAAAVAVAFAVFSPAAAGAQALIPSADAARILGDVTVLADDKWEGRGTCTPGNDSAAVFIANRFASLQLVAKSGNGGSGTDAYLHSFVVRANRPGSTAPAACNSWNVAGMLGGSDPSLAGEYIVIGAHFDHLGRGTAGALDAAAGDIIRNGADDNASGTAAILELARLFRDAPTRRSILFVAFSGEELGLLGSAKFAEESMPQGRVHAMVNFDMVGRLRDDRLIVNGIGTATELIAIVDAENTGTPFQLGKVPDGFGPSDHSSFYAKEIPVLHFFTDAHEDYHRATDDADKINAGGVARIVDYTARVIRNIADRQEQLTFVRQAPPAPPSGGTRPYFGSIPDMAGGDVPGLRLTGVTPGSPAEKGGLKAGDIVVELGGKPVTDLSTYSEALSAYKPGDTITVVVLRDGQRVSLTVTLASRSG